MAQNILNLETSQRSESKLCPSFFLDARNMEPPEPLIEGIKALENLSYEQFFYMVHRIEPKLLLPEATRRQIDFRIVIESDQVHLVFWHQYDVVANNLAAEFMDSHAFQSVLNLTSDNE